MVKEEDEDIVEEVNDSSQSSRERERKEHSNKYLLALLDIAYRAFLRLLGSTTT